MPFYDRITEPQKRLIEESQMFFVASAAPGLEYAPDGSGPVNISPKGDQRLYLVDDNCVAYLDFPGSGNETARHSEQDGEVTVMICSFNAPDAAIVRLYGKAEVRPASDPLAQRLAGDLPARKQRQLIKIKIKKTQTSCGYSVPIMTFVRDRTRIERGLRYKK